MLITSNYCDERFIVSGMMRRDELDQRAIDGLKGLGVESALAVLEELKGCNLQAVSNKSAYMCGIMKSLRQKLAAGLMLDLKRPGPDEHKLKVFVIQIVKNALYQNTESCNYPVLLRYINIILWSCYSHSCQLTLICRLVYCKLADPYQWILTNVFSSLLN